MAADPPTHARFPSTLPVWVIYTLTSLPISARADFGSLLVTDAQATFVGEGPNEQAGWSLSFAGDTNGDGLDDLLIGAQLNDDAGMDAGKAYLILGSSTGLLGNVDLLFADASFEGEASEDYAGSALASAGDLDGDGYDDFLIGAWGQDRGGGSSGKVYLYYGSPFAPGPQLLQLAPASFVGEAPGDIAGFSLAPAGDVTGDGYPDFLVGAPNQDGGGSNSGRVYLVPGGIRRYAGEVALSQAAHILQGAAANDHFGAAFSCSIDWTGDGLNDPLVGSAGQDRNGAEAGAAYLFASEALGPGINRAAEAHLIILGGASGDQLGTSVAQLRDLDGDQLPELALGAPRSAYGATWGGAVFLISSRLTSSGVVIADPSLPLVYGTEAYGEVGRTLSSCGDLNLDGRDELLIGAPNLDRSGKANAGAVGWLKWADGKPAQRFDQLTGLFLGPGEASLAGFSLASQSDVDGDDRAELLIGAAGSGTVFLFYSRLYFDDDGDGLTELGGDCDDSSALPTYPVAEIPYDGLDQDCDGLDLTDQDGDGVSAQDAGGTDCDDFDPSTQPFAAEVADGVDQDCDGLIDDGTTSGDDDGDGFSELEGDCRDDDPAIGPDRPEQPNGLDDNCNGQVDEPSPTADQDGDGLSTLDGDCNDTDPTIHPGSSELPDGVDQDCDGLEDDLLSTQDLDEDGFTPLEGDLDDTDPSTFPGAVDIQDGIDNDGDGFLDEGITDPAPDLDGDGFSEQEGDIDDSQPDIYPGAPDGPDGLDNDGDGLLDEDPPEVLDQDGDGYSPSVGDGDDSNPDVYPGAPELNDGIDNDGDGQVDEDSLDQDGDGYSPQQGDCDDEAPQTFPGAPEEIDGQDQNCNGVNDEGTAVYDDDQDGYSEVDDDCDDSNSALHPDQPDSCDGLDNNCDGILDETCLGQETPASENDPESSPGGAAGSQSPSEVSPTATADPTTVPSPAGPGEWNGAIEHTPAESLDPSEDPIDATGCGCNQSTEQSSGSPALLLLSATALLLRRLSKRS